MTEGRKRLLGTAGKKGCKFACVYCFTHDPDFKRCPVLDSKRPSSLIAESKGVEIVQPACDTELFLMEDWKEYLDKLVSAGRVVSFATKAIVPDEDVQFLKRINELLMSRGSALHICVTIVRLFDWQDLEPNAPSPSDRIRFLRRLWEAGIGTCVAVRPMIPFVQDGELEELVSKTYRFCYGYMSGPLYLTRGLREYLRERGIVCESVKKKAEWQTGEPELEVVYSRELEKRLCDVAAEAGRKYFESNLEAAYYVRKAQTDVPKDFPVWGPEVRRERVATLYIVDPATKQFLLMFHRNLGAWLAPGGHVELGESLTAAASREAQEEVGVIPTIVDLKGTLPRGGKHFVCVDTPHESPSFCTVEEFIEPIGGHDPHIHVDAIIVGLADSQKPALKRDVSEVTAHDWFSIEQIENDIETFDNVPIICRAIRDALEESKRKPPTSPST